MTDYAELVIELRAPRQAVVEVGPQHDRWHDLVLRPAPELDIRAATAIEALQAKVAEMEAHAFEDAIVIGKYNSGEALQNLMALNNQLVAERDAHLKLMDQCAAEAAASTEIASDTSLADARLAAIRDAAWKAGMEEAAKLAGEVIARRREHLSETESARSVAAAIRAAIAERQETKG